MIIVVDPSSAVPPFEQVRAQVATMIATGVLAPGSTLPPIRQLAADLGIASGTVARAYAELDRSGLVSGRGRQGTRVLQPAHPPEDVDADLLTAARSYALRAHQLGVDRDRALAAAREALDQTAVAAP
jgi:DNA-binding transcriptional regulator YhcF (GntR family)